MSGQTEMALADRLECSENSVIRLSGRKMPIQLSATERDLIVAALRRPAPTEPDIRAAAFEECARFIESGSGMADLIDQDDLDQQAKYIRSLALSSGEPDTNLQKMQIAPEGVTGEAVAFINVRLADLAEANALYDNDKRLNAPDKIARNDREISWLKDLRSIIVYASPQPAARISPEHEADLAELTDGHLALDRLGAAREEHGVELAIVHRIGEIGLRTDAQEPQPATKMGREEVIEECAKVAETLKTLHVWLPVDNGEDPNHHTTKHGKEIAEAIRAITASAPAGGCADSRANR